MSGASAMIGIVWLAMTYGHEGPLRQPGMDERPSPARGPSRLPSTKPMNASAPRVERGAEQVLAGRSGRRRAGTAGPSPQTMFQTCGRLRSFAIEPGGTAGSSRPATREGARRVATACRRGTSIPSQQERRRRRSPIRMASGRRTVVRGTRGEAASSSSSSAVLRGRWMPLCAGTPTRVGPSSLSARLALSPSRPRLRSTVRRR